MLSTEHRPALWRRAVVGTLAGVAAATAGWAAARGVGQSLLVVGRGEGPVAVPLGAVALATVAGGLGGWVMAAAAGRTRRPRAAFLAAVVVGFAVSTVPPLTGAADPATTCWLLGLHAVVAGAIVPPLASALPSRRTAAASSRVRIEMVAAPSARSEESR